MLELGSFPQTLALVAADFRQFPAENEVSLTKPPVRRHVNPLKSAIGQCPPCCDVESDKGEVVNSAKLAQQSMIYKFTSR
jgi:hypothetical protein